MKNKVTVSNAALALLIKAEALLDQGKDVEVLILENDEFVHFCKLSKGDFSVSPSHIIYNDNEGACLRCELTHVKDNQIHFFSVDRNSTTFKFVTTNTVYKNI